MPVDSREASLSQVSQVSQSVPSPEIVGQLGHFGTAHSLRAIPPFGDEQPQNRVK